MNPRPALVIALLAGTGCGPPITAADVNKIQLCTTTFAEVTQMFGSPKHRSRLGDLNVHEFTSGPSAATREPSHRLLIAYNERDVVVDVLLDLPAYTTATISDHCKSK